jgi:protease stability complex PrcB-like protein
MLLFVFFALWQGPTSGIPMKPLDVGMESQIEEPHQLTARSAEEWAKLWREHAGERARPSVDFARDMVVGVFLGSRPTAGFGVQIVSARVDRGALVVQYRETRPPSGSLTAQVLTSPYQLVTLPKRAGDIRFEKIE